MKWKEDNVARCLLANACAMVPTRLVVCWSKLLHNACEQDFHVDTIPISAIAHMIEAADVSNHETGAATATANARYMSSPCVMKLLCQRVPNHACVKQDAMRAQYDSEQHPEGFIALSTRVCKSSAASGRFQEILEVNGPARLSFRRFFQQHPPTTVHLHPSAGVCETRAYLTSPDKDTLGAECLFAR